MDEQRLLARATTLFEQLTLAFARCFNTPLSVAARELYERAQAGGIEDARERIEALKWGSADARDADRSGGREAGRHKGEGTHQCVKSRLSRQRRSLPGSITANPGNMISAKDARVVIMRYGERREHRPVADFQLLKNVMQVHLDGAIGNIQPAPNFLI